MAEADETTVHHCRPVRLHRAAAAAGLLLVGALVYAPAVVGPPFYTKGEPREAVVVAQIVRQRDAVVPVRLDGEIVSKPPLFHWLGAAVALSTGRLDEASVRAPSLVASLLVVALTIAAGYRMFGTTAGLVAGAVLLTSQQWITSSVTARVDMTLAATIAVAMFAFARASAASEPVVPVTFYAAVALAVLAKGPVGYVLPVLGVGLAEVASGRTPREWRLRPLIAAGLLASPLLWYALAWYEVGRPLVDKVIAENFHRMVDAQADQLGHQHGPWFYLPALLGGMAPWSLLLPAVLVSSWRERSGPGGEHRRFAAVWALTTIAFYSLADSKRPVYVLSAYPALALLLGDWMARRFSTATDAPDRGHVGARTVAWLAGILAAVVSLVIIVAALQSLGVPVLRPLESVLSPGDRANLLAVERSLGARPVVVLLWALVAGTLSVVLTAATGRRRWRAAFMSAVALVLASVAIITPTVFRDVAETQSVKPFIAQVVEAVPDAPVVFFYAPGNAESELYFFRTFQYAATFYARRPVRIVGDVALAKDDHHVRFVAAESTFRAMQDAGDARRDYRVLARHAYDDNPRREPVVFVEGAAP